MEELESWQTVSTVADNVCASAVARGIRGKVDVCACKLVGLALAAHGDLASPHVLGLLGDEIGDLRGGVAWGDGVCAGELDPFDAKRFAWAHG